MPNPLNNAVTAAGYTAAATFQAQPTRSVFVQVYNAAVYYQVTTRRGGVVQPAKPERFLAPGRGAFEAGYDWPDDEQLVTIEFRSATATPASVSAS